MVGKHLVFPGQHCKFDWGAHLIVINIIPLKSVAMYEGRYLRDCYGWVKPFTVKRVEDREHESI